MPAADFLDPLHHEAATGRPSINLDGWMLNKEQNLASFHRHAADADICIVEGVMGLFDGRDGMTEAGSTAELAKWLGAPVLLVMDCWSMARSAAAMVKGYQEFDPDLNLAGVIFNKVGSPAHSQWLSEAVQSTGVTTQVFGGVPKVHQLHLVQCMESHAAYSPGRPHLSASHTMSVSCACPTHHNTTLRPAVCRQPDAACCTIALSSIFPLLC